MWEVGTYGCACRGASEGGRAGPRQGKAWYSSARSHLPRDVVDPQLVVRVAAPGVHLARLGHGRRVVGPRAGAAHAVGLVQQRRQDERVDGVVHSESDAGAQLAVRVAPPREHLAAARRGVAGVAAHRRRKYGVAPKPRDPPRRKQPAAAANHLEHAAAAAAALATRAAAAVEVAQQVEPVEPVDRVDVVRRPARRETQEALAAELAESHQRWPAARGRGDVERVHAARPVEVAADRDHRRLRREVGDDGAEEDPALEPDQQGLARAVGGEVDAPQHVLNLEAVEPVHVQVVVPPGAS